VCSDILFFISGCKSTFKAVYAGWRIKLLDLTKKDEAKIWLVVSSNDKVNSFDIISINSYHNGSEIKNRFLKEKLNKKGSKKEKPKKKKGRWEATIQVNFLLIIL
jgi:hypothetical protein